MAALHGEVERGDDLRLRRRLLRRLGLPAVGAWRLIAFDHLDAEVAQEEEDVVDLLGRELDVLQRVVHVLGVQVALLAALGDQLAHFLDVELGWFARLAFC